MLDMRTVLWLVGLAVGGWLLWHFLVPGDARETWSKIGDYCDEAKNTGVDSEAEVNSLASRYGLTPQRRIDHHNRTQILVYRPAVLGTDVSCRVTFEGSKVDIQYVEPGGLGGLIFKLAR